MIELTYTEMFVNAEVIPDKIMRRGDFAGKTVILVQSCGKVVAVVSESRVYIDDLSPADTLAIAEFVVSKPWVGTKVVVEPMKPFNREMPETSACVRRGVVGQLMTCVIDPSCGVRVYEPGTEEFFCLTLAESGIWYNPRKAEFFYYED